MTELNEQRLQQQQQQALLLTLQEELLRSKREIEHMSAEKNQAEKYKEEAEIWRKKYEGNNQHAYGDLVYAH